MQELNDIYQVYPAASMIKCKDQFTPIYRAVDADFNAAVNYLTKVCPAATSISIAIYCLNTKSMLDP